MTLILGLVSVKDMISSEVFLFLDLKQGQHNGILAGILKSVDAKQRTAVVRWLKPVSRPEELREFGEEETVSVYELIGHPDYAYCLGDVVIRLSPAPCDVSESQADGSEASSVEGTCLTSLGLLQRKLSLHNGRKKNYATP